MAQTGFSKILTYKSDTATTIPAAGDLTNGAGGAELAVNTADKRLFTKDSGGNVVELGTNPSSITLPNGTANGVVYANGSKVLTTGSALTFDGANLATGRLLSGRYTSDANGWGIQSYATNAYGSGIQLVYGGVGAAAMWVPAASSLAFGADVGAGTTEQMRLTLTGLGIGTSNPGAPLEVFRTSTSAAALRLRYNSTSYYGEHSMNPNGDYQVSSPTSNGVTSGNLLLRAGGAMNFATNNNSYSAIQMQLDPSGNLGLGVTPSAWNSGVRMIEFVGASIGSNNTPSQFFINSNAYLDSVGWKYKASNYACQYQAVNGTHQWFTAPSGTAGNAISFTQAMTLDASGNLVVGTTTALAKLTVADSGAGSAASFSSAAINQDCMSLFCTATTASVYGFSVYSSASSGNTAYLFRGYNNTSTLCFGVAGNGNVTNTNNSYGAISDQALKENIVDATPKLADLLKVQVRQFNLKADETKTKQIGVIAQELETVFPAMVDESADGIKSVKYSVFVPMLVKAIQELKIELDETKAEVAALKAS